MRRMLMLALILGLSFSSFALAAEDKKRISRPGAKPIPVAAPGQTAGPGAGRGQTPSTKPLAAKAEVDTFPQQQFGHPALDGLIEDAKIAPLPGKLHSHEFQSGVKQDQLKPSLEFHFPADKPRTSLIDKVEQIPRQAEVVDYSAVEKAYVDAAPVSPNPAKKAEAKMTPEEEQQAAQQNQARQYEWWVRQQQARAGGAGGGAGVDGDRCLCGTYVPSFHCMQSRSNPLTAGGFQTAARNAGTVIQNALAGTR
jgi:hypothetical protein